MVLSLNLKTVQSYKNSLLVNTSPDSLHANQSWCVILVCLLFVRNLYPVNIDVKLIRPMYVLFKICSYVQTVQVALLHYKQ